MADDTAVLSPEDLLYYAQRRNAASRAYRQGNSNLAYQQGVGAQDYGYNLGDLQKRFKQVYDQMPGAYARRGVSTSGIAQQGYEKYGTEYADAVGRLNQQNQQQLQGYALQQGQLDDSYNSATSDLDAQESARKSATAASYAATKQYGI